MFRAVRPSVSYNDAKRIIPLQRKVVGQILGLGLSVAVLRTCVEDKALGGLMSPRLNSDLDFWRLLAS